MSYAYLAQVEEFVPGAVNVLQVSEDHRNRHYADEYCDYRSRCGKESELTQTVDLLLGVDMDML